MATVGSRATPGGDREVIVRLAELEIDPAQLDSYKALLAEEIEASVRTEQGVLMLHAVSVKGQPRANSHIRGLCGPEGLRSASDFTAFHQVQDFDIGHGPVAAPDRDGPDHAAR